MTLSDQDSEKVDNYVKYYVLMAAIGSAVMIALIFNAQTIVVFACGCFGVLLGGYAGHSPRSGPPSMIPKIPGADEELKIEDTFFEGSGPYNKSVFRYITPTAIIVIALLSFIHITEHQSLPPLSWDDIAIGFISLLSGSGIALGIGWALIFWKVLRAR